MTLAHFLDDSSASTLTQSSDQTIPYDSSQDLTGDEFTLGRPIRRSKVDAQKKIKRIVHIFSSGQAGLRYFSPIDTETEERRASRIRTERKRRSLCKKWGVERLGDLVKKPRIMDDPEVVNSFSSSELCLLVAKDEKAYFVSLDSDNELKTPNSQANSPVLQLTKVEEMSSIRERIAKVRVRMMYLQIDISKLPKQVKFYAIFAEHYCLCSIGILGSELMTAIKGGLMSWQAECGVYGRPVAQSTPVCSVYNAGINRTTNPSEATFQPC